MVAGVVLAGAAPVAAPFKANPEDLVTSTIHTLECLVGVEDCDSDDPDDPGDDDPKPDVYVGYVGDIEWCNTHSADWEATASSVFNDTEQAIQSKTDIDIRWAYAVCITTPGTYHHSEGNYAHDNGDGDDELEHPYPFNRVPGNHQISECVEPTNDDDHPASYLNADQGIYDSDGNWHSADSVVNMTNYNGYTGVFAYRHDAESNHGMEPHADMIQILHDSDFNGGDLYGRACLPTLDRDDEMEGSGVRQPSLDTAVDGTDVGPSHEMGHTFDAYHCDSAQVSGGYTLMASHADDQCPENTDFAHVFEYSDTAATEIESWADDNYT